MYTMQSVIIRAKSAITVSGKKKIKTKKMYSR